MTTASAPQTLTTASAPQTLTTADAIRTLMAHWDQLYAIAQRLNPDASDEELYQLTQAAMNRAIPIH